MGVAMQSGTHFVKEVTELVLKNRPSVDRGRRGERPSRKM